MRPLQNSKVRVFYLITADYSINLTVSKRNKALLKVRYNIDMNLKQFIHENTPLISSVLSDYFEKKKLSVQDSLSRESIQKLSDFTTKGKMLRGNFVLLSHEMFNGSQKDAAINIAAALEINQSGLLIHDDIMDNDRIRRGDKSLFVKLEDVGESRQTLNSRQYGLAMGILLGDTSFFLSYQMLLEAEIHPGIIQKITSAYTREMLTVSHGQLLDLDFGLTPYNPTKDEIITMYRQKTGGYTFILPFTLGAILAGASTKDLDTLTDFGDALGTVFQIVDDYIGLFGSMEKTGKPVGSDIRENKKTLIRHLLYEYATDSEKEILEGAFGNAELSEDDIKKIQTISQNHNIKSQIYIIVEEYTAKARSAIEALSVTKQYKIILNELVDYLIGRDS